MVESSGWNLLVVEDEPDGQAVVEGLLNNFKITSEAVATAEEAIDRLGHNAYNGVIIDLGLPGMDGMDLLNVIRKNPTTAALPCVAITAFHSSKVKKEALDAGFNAYVAKPLDRAYLLEELNRVIVQ